MQSFKSYFIINNNSFNVKKFGKTELIKVWPNFVLTDRVWTIEEATANVGANGTLLRWSLPLLHTACTKRKIGNKQMCQLIYWLYKGSHQLVWLDFSNKNNTLWHTLRAVQKCWLFFYKKCGVICKILLDHLFQSTIYGLQGDARCSEPYRPTKKHQDAPFL